MIATSNAGWDQSRRAGTPAHQLKPYHGGPALALLAGPTLRYYYGNFTSDHSRWESYGFEPRYSTEYVGLRGRIGILSESYSYTDYKTRVLVSREFVRQCVESTLAHCNRIASLLQSIESQSTEAANKFCRTVDSARCRDGSV